MQTHTFTFSRDSAIDRQNCAVFLPGWGFDGRIIKLADPAPPWVTPDARLPPAATAEALAAFLDQHQIDSIVLAGWSLGAYLAIDFALRYPARVKALYLLALRQTWPAAEIEALLTDLRKDPGGFMKTFYRKCFLGHQSSYRQFKASLEAPYLADLEPADLAAGLVYLQNFSLAARQSDLARLDFPIYLLHGGKDIIAPPGERPVIPGAVSRLLKSAGHPVFLDEACRLDWHRKKETIRQKFSRAAASYDEHASVQQEVAARLATLLPRKAPATILETGCGTGNYTRLLRAHYPEARITALDFAENMVAEARQKFAADPAVALHCADAEVFLKENPGRFELITANATLHWFDNLDNTARLIAERLTPAGALVCSIFGPETLREMQAGLSAIHAREVTLPPAFFPSRAELEKILTNRFSEVEITEWQLVRPYPTLSGLLRNIRKTGTAGWHPGQRLLNRHHLRELEQWFVNTYGQCRISYQIFMVTGRR